MLPKQSELLRGFANGLDHNFSRDNCNHHKSVRVLQLVKFNTPVLVEHAQRTQLLDKQETQTQEVKRNFEQ